MIKTVALIGAGGKMGFRIAKKIRELSNFQLHCVEIEATAAERLRTIDIETMSIRDAVSSAEVVILAVPDSKIGEVAAEVVRASRNAPLLICLDPAASYAGSLQEIHSAIFICHPCHPMLFDPAITVDVADDFHGGRAIQDIVCALHSGDERDYDLGISVARFMFSPVRKCFRVSVPQMALLEPALVETTAATLLYAIREIQDAVVRAGIPGEVVRSFLLGHLRLELGIIFGFTDIQFSDGAKLAIKSASQKILVNGWKAAVLDELNVRETVKSIVSSNQNQTAR